MAATGPPPAPLQCVALFIFFLVVFSPPAQSYSPLRAAKFAGGALNYEEVTTSLVVNQLAILQMMENDSNASCGTEQAGRLEALAGLERRLQQVVQTVEAGLGHLEQAVQAVEAGQERRLEQAVQRVEDGLERHLQQVLEAVTNQTDTQDMLTITGTEQAGRLEALAGLERRLQQVVQTVEAGLGRLEQAVQAVEAGQERRLEQAVQTVEDGLERHLQQVLEAVTNQTDTQDMLTRMAELRKRMDMFLMARDPQQGPTSGEVTSSLATMPQDTTEPLLCSGIKSIVSSVGSLEVVRHGQYEDNTDCIWDINFPIRAPVELKWDYFDLEDENTCDFDWVEVVDRTNEETVYGHKLCGTKQNMSLMLTVLPPTSNILVKFHSDGSSAGRGFRLNYLQLKPTFLTLDLN